MNQNDLARWRNTTPGPWREEDRSIVGSDGQAVAGLVPGRMKAGDRALIVASSELAHAVAAWMRAHRLAETSDENVAHPGIGDLDNEERALLLAARRAFPPARVLEHSAGTVIDARPPPERKSAEALQAECDAFNARNPLGSPVIVLRDGGGMTAAKVRAPAEILSGHSAVVWVEGIRGCYLLERVKPGADPGAGCG